MEVLKQNGWTEAKQNGKQLSQTLGGGSPGDRMYQLYDNWPRITFRYVKSLRDKPQLELLCPGQLLNRIDGQYELTEKDKMIQHFEAYGTHLARRAPAGAHKNPPPPRHIGTLTALREATGSKSSSRCLASLRWRDFHPETW